MKFDALIVGGGLAGLVCGIRCAQAGLKTGIIAKGESGLAFASGTIDLLGFDATGQTLDDPVAAIERLIQRAPEHPYAKLGITTLLKSIDWFQQLTDSMGLAYRPHTSGNNHQRITALGALRPSYLAPASIPPSPVGLAPKKRKHCDYPYRRL